MTKHFKEKPSFYFTLYHELMHLKRDYNKLKNKTIIDEDDTEDEMNALALNEMIDEKIYKEILNKYYDKDRIALENNIPLSFLYTRLAREGRISYRSSEYLKNIEKI
jgi:Zn-dependent peptidase ImmA (M78 family)